MTGTHCDVPDLFVFQKKKMLLNLIYLYIFEIHTWGFLSLHFELPLNINVPL